MTSPATLVERVVSSMAELATLGETIADEWTYVHDLELVWAARLRAVAAGRLAADVDKALEAAIDRLCGETSRITDPHRAIDWLSTLPVAALVALGEDAW